ncbi:Seipin [Halotydeus destructor]|nr:Seipin [Halotydeus destructor]
MASLPDVSFRNRFLANANQAGSVSSINSEEFDRQLNSAMYSNDQESELEFKLVDVFSPKKIILFLWRTLHRATFGTIFLLVLLWASVFMYISFYYLYIPALDMTHSVHFQFDSICTDKCTLPMANIYLSQYKSPTFFVKGQQYRVGVELDLPESDTNWDQGMFMLKVELFDTNMNLITSASRPAILQYKSPLLRVLSTVVYWPLLVTGLKSETQHLSIPLIESFADGLKPKAGSAAMAVVTLEARTIQVYSSTLLISANLSGLRYLMVNYPLLTGLIGVSTIFGFLTMITICGVYRIVSEDEDGEYENSDAGSEEPFSGSTSMIDEPYSPDSTVDD